jgi:hypothetical protein
MIADYRTRLTDPIAFSASRERRFAALFSVFNKGVKLCLQNRVDK